MYIHKHTYELQNFSSSCHQSCKWTIVRVDWPLCRGCYLLVNMDNGILTRPLLAYCIF